MTKADFYNPSIPNIECAICGKSYQKKRGSFARHINRSHKVLIEDYVRKYIISEGDDKCVVCGKPTKYNLRTMKFRQVCSHECNCKSDTMKNKRVETLVEKHGTSDVNSIPVIMKKKRETMLKRYGVTSITQIPERVKEIKLKHSKTAKAKNPEGYDAHKKENDFNIEQDEMIAGSILIASKDEDDGFEEI